ncbi:MAG: hypothetical protein U0470_07220 [Anaerolineae bacterium]
MPPSTPWPKRCAWTTRGRTTFLLARLTCDRELACPGTADLAAAQAALSRAEGRAPPPRCAPAAIASTGW